MHSPWPPQRHLFRSRQYHRPRAILVLIGICVLSFIIGKITDVFSPGAYERLFGLSRAGLEEGHYWQLVTYLFVHGGFWHLLGNTLVLYFVGRRLEQMVESRSVATLFFVSGIIAGIAQLLVSLSNPANVIILGASGAAFAILIAYCTMEPEEEITLLLFFILPIRIRAKYLGIGSAVVVVLMLLMDKQSNVGHLAHLVGCIAGWFYASQLIQTNRRGNQFLEVFRRGRGWIATFRNPSDAFISREVDRILDKVSREGIHSLSAKEQKILARNSEAIGKRAGKQ